MYEVTDRRQPIERLAYTIDQACEACGFSRTRLYQRIARGELQTFRDGKRRMVLARELRRFIEAAAADGLAAVPNVPPLPRAAKPRDVSAANAARSRRRAGGAA